MGACGGGLVQILRAIYNGCWFQLRSKTLKHFTIYVAQNEMWGGGLTNGQTKSLELFIMDVGFNFGQKPLNI